jgi:hypothetical protein
LCGSNVAGSNVGSSNVRFPRWFQQVDATLYLSSAEQDYCSYWNQNGNDPLIQNEREPVT